MAATEVKVSNLAIATKWTDEILAANIHVFKCTLPAAAACFSQTTVAVFQFHEDVFVMKQTSVEVHPKTNGLNAISETGFHL